MARRVCKRWVRRCRRRRQKDDFLNRYDFAYTGRDTRNTVMKGVKNLAPKLMKQFPDQVNSVVQQKIQQIIDQDGQTVEKIALKTIRCAIENVYQTPFRLLVKFGKRKLNQLKQKVNKGLKSI